MRRNVELTSRPTEDITLRDYFAASVVGHMIASGIYAENHDTFEAAIAHMAEDAYEVADAMLEVRKMTSNV